ncbi:MAG: glycosyltransferase family 39 protein [Nanoarchaeota archaeon]
MAFKRFLKDNWILIIILVLALTLRVYNLENKEYGTDENFSIEYGKDAVNGNLMGVIAKDVHPPLYYIITGYLLRLYDSIYFLRILSLLIGLLGILLTYKITKDITKDKNLGLLTAFLLSINPMHIIYSVQLRAYILLSLIYLACIWILYQYIFNKKSKIIYLLIPLYLLSFYMHFYTIFMIGTHVILVGYFKLRDKIKIKDYVKTLIISSIGMLLYLPIFIRQFKFTIIDEGNFALTRLRLTEIPYPFYKFAVMINYSTVKEQLLILLVLAIILTSLMLYGMYRLYKYNNREFYFIIITFFGIILLPLILNPLIEYLSKGRTTLYYFRYFTYIIPIYVFLIANGLNIKNKIIKYTLIGIIIIGWMIALNYYYNIMTTYGWSRLIAV